LAQEFAAARPAAIKGGVNFQQHSEAEAMVQSICALSAICGHWALPGGGVHIESSPGQRTGRAEGSHLRPREGRALQLAELGEILSSSSLDPPIKALMVWGTNPAVVQPDASAVRRGLLREDLFTVVLEHFLTETAALADLVLPSTTQLEHFDVLGSWGHHYVTLNEPAIEPLGEARSHGWVCRELSRRLGLPEPSDEEIVRDFLPEGVTLEALRQEGRVKVERGGATAPIKLNFSVRLPGFPTPEHPLVLLTPKGHHSLNSSFINQTRHATAEGRPTLEMHPADAAARELSDGNLVRVWNERGEVRAYLKVTDAIVQGVTSLPARWWHAQMPGGRAANTLTPAGTTRGGQPRYNECFVEVGR
jgi:anaerobic selenocysteine-containing dehydrogenase